MSTHDASFRTTGSAYDRFMGRYSRGLARPFVDAAGVAAGDAVLDVGCGPGALTSVLVDRVGARRVAACDPSASFVAECAARHPGVVVREARAEALPFPDGSFDAVLTQLVLHFVGDPDAAVREFLRVVRPGGVVAACVWDFADGMQMLRLFWDAALAVDPGAPDEARVLRFGAAGEAVELFEGAGLRDVQESLLTVSSTYDGFDELWDGFLAGIGPAGQYCVELPPAQREAVRNELHARLGSPRGPFTLSATARSTAGRAPA